MNSWSGKKKVLVAFSVFLTVVFVFGAAFGIIHYKRLHTVNNIYDEIYLAVADEKRQMLDGVENVFFASRGWRDFTFSIWNCDNSTVGSYTVPYSTDMDQNIFFMNEPLPISTEILFLKKPRVIVFC